MVAHPYDYLIAVIIYPEEPNALLWNKGKLMYSHRIRTILILQYAKFKYRFSFNFASSCNVIVTLQCTTIVLSDISWFVTRTTCIPGTICVLCTVHIYIIFPLVRWHRTCSVRMQCACGSVFPYEWTIAGIQPTELTLKSTPKWNFHWETKLPETINFDCLVSLVLRDPHVKQSQTSNYVQCNFVYYNFKFIYKQ